MAENKKTKVELSEKDFERLDKMICGISLKKREYAEKVGLDQDIIYQECWLRTMEVIGEWHGEMPPDALIATCCFNHIIDLGRKQFVRVGQIPVDPSIFEFDDTDLQGNRWNNMRECFWNQNLKVGTDTSMIFVEEIENLFEEGSKEKAYIRQVEIYCGVREVPKEEFDSMFEMNTSMRNEIAWNLGYANSSSWGFRGIEWKVREKILEYLGLKSN